MEEVIKNKYGKHIIRLEIHLINIPEFLQVGMELKIKIYHSEMPKYKWEDQI